MDETARPEVSSPVWVGTKADLKRLLDKANSLFQDEYAGFEAERIRETEELNSRGYGEDSRKLLLGNIEKKFERQSTPRFDAVDRSSGHKVSGTVEELLDDQAEIARFSRISVRLPPDYLSRRRSVTLSFARSGYGAGCTASIEGDATWAGGAVYLLTNEFKRNRPGWAWLRRLGGLPLVLIGISSLLIAVNLLISSYFAADADPVVKAWVVNGILVGAYLVLFIMQSRFLPAFEVMDKDKPSTGTRRLLWLGGVFGAALAAALFRRILG